MGVMRQLHADALMSGVGSQSKYKVIRQRRACVSYR
jgi:hypothetical protein